MGHRNVIQKPIRCVIIYILATSFSSNSNGWGFKINCNLDCNSSSILYLVNGKNCQVQQYEGSNIRKFRTRLTNHNRQDKSLMEISKSLGARFADYSV